MPFISIHNTSAQGKNIEGVLESRAPSEGLHDARTQTERAKDELIAAYT